MARNFRRMLLINVGIAATGTAVLVGTAGWFAADVGTQASAIAKDRVLAADRTASLAALAELKSDAAQAQQYKTKLNAFLPTQDQLLDFPRTLDDLARVRRLALDFSFQGGQTAPKGTTPGSVSFTLGVTGALDDILNFMKDVEISPPRFLASFNAFDLTRSGENQYRLSARGRVFFGE